MAGNRESDPFTPMPITSSLMAPSGALHDAVRHALH